MQEYYLDSIPRRALTSERTILNSIAQPNPATSNPGTILLTKSTNSPFMIKEKIPNVKRFIGRVKIVTTGFIKALIIPSTTATTTASKKLATFTPD